MGASCALQKENADILSTTNESEDGIFKRQHARRWADNKKHENKISYVIDMFRFLTSLSSNLLSAM